MKMLTDLEAINQICEKSGQYYSKALSFQRIGADAEALVNYRSALKVLLTTLADRNKISLSGERQISTIHEDIQTISEKLRLSFHVVNLMGEIRVSGNKGSHTEHYLAEDFKQLAETTREHFIELIKSIPPEFSGLANPKEILISGNSIDLKELAYLALCEDDSEAAYMVAMHLLTHYRLMHKYTVKRDFDTYYHHAWSKIITLLKSCYSTEPDAAYCLAKIVEVFGVNCIPNYKDIGSEKLVFIKLMERAANFGNIRAEFEYGEILVSKKSAIEEDIEYGMEFLKSASSKGEPRASMYLAQYYANRKKADLHEMYLKLSAEQGLAISKVEYAKHILRKGNYELIDLARLYLEEALAEGEAQAAYWLAKILQKTTEKRTTNTDRLVSLYKQAAHDSSVVLSGDEWLDVARQLDKLNSGNAVEALFRCNEAALKEGNEKLYLFANIITSKVGLIHSKDGAPEVYVDPMLHTNYKSLSFTLNKPSPDALPKVQRNDLCPCGSGKKYKKCCLR